MLLIIRIAGITKIEQGTVLIMYRRLISGDKELMKAIKIIKYHAKKDMDGLDTWIINSDGVYMTDKPPRLI